MMLLSTTLWINIQLAVIQMMITDVLADTSKKTYTTQSPILEHTFSNQSSPETTSHPSPSNIIDGSTVNDILFLKSSDDAICNFNVNHNISNMNNSEIEALIQSQAKDISMKNINITKGFQEIDGMRSIFAKSPDFKTGYEAMQLAMNYLESSANLLESIKEYNSLVRAYRCTNINKSYDVYEISEKEFENTFKYNENVCVEFYYLYNLALMFVEVRNQNKKYGKALKQYGSSQTLDDLNVALIEMNITVYMIDNFVQEQEKFHNFLGNNKLHQSFQTKNMLYISNITHWKEDLLIRRDELKFYENYAANTKFSNLLNRKIQPIVHGIIFAVGIVGNLVLLIIFIRHKEMRNPPSMMILNLTIADAFNLPLNIPTFLIYLTSHSWDYGEGLCITFRFLRQLGIAVSIYSIVVISIQRFLALTQMFKNNGWGSKLSTRLKSVLLILSVWITGLLVAIPHTIHAGLYDGQCYGGSEDNKDYAKFITLFDFILFCTIPLTIIATLSLATALIIRRSVQNIPGETMGMDKYIKTRIVSANVLIALTVVSAASYFPYYLFMFLHAWEKIQIDKKQYQIIFFIVYTLVFANCCFNPIALYIFSRKFRKYIHKYILCRKMNEVNDGRKVSSGTTTSSSFMTKI